MEKEVQKKDLKKGADSAIPQEEEKWYEDRSTLVALITGFISCILSLLNVLMGMGG